LFLFFFEEDGEENTEEKEHGNEKEMEQIA
jgi:hypothetical protein